LEVLDGEVLEKARARNSLQGVNGVGPRRLARYARALVRQIEVHDQAALLRGAVAFPDPEAIAMSEPNPPNSAAPWHIPVAAEDVPDTGQHFDLVAEPSVRAAIVKVAGLLGLPRFESNFDVIRQVAG